MCAVVKQIHTATGALAFSSLLDKFGVDVKMQMFLLLQK